MNSRKTVQNAKRCSQCDGKHYAKGLCYRHYARGYQKARRVDWTRQAGVREVACAIEHCGRIVYAKGYCRKHYTKAAYGRDPAQAYPRHLRRRPVKCLWPGCRERVEGVQELWCPEHRKVGRAIRLRLWWYRAKEKQLAVHRADYNKHRDGRLAYQREYYRKNRNRLREASRAREAAQREAQTLAVTVGET